MIATVFFFFALLSGSETTFADVFARRQVLEAAEAAGSALHEELRKELRNAVANAEASGQRL